MRILKLLAIGYTLTCCVILVQSMYEGLPPDPSEIIRAHTLEKQLGLSVTQVIHSTGTFQ